MTRVLLNWFEMPGRPELLSVFTAISDRIEFIHLYHRTRADRTDVVSPFKMIYWFDYSNPWQIIDEVRPDRIVTMNADDLLSISLIVAARKRNIPTYAMQHGFVPENLDEVFVELERPAITQKGIFSRYRKLLAFFLSSIRPFSLQRYREYFLFMKSYFREGAAKATRKFQYDWRKPDYYICFSKQGGKYFELRDNVPPGKLLEIGVPMFDTFFQQAEAHRRKQIEYTPVQPYYLLIDTSFGEYKEEVSIDTIYRCYRELESYCKKRNAILHIKLHPWSYKEKAFTNSDSIIFHRQMDQHDLTNLVLGSTACFGFFSTLTLPVVSVKKLCQVVYDNICYQELIDLHITPCVDFFRFTEEDITLGEFEVNEINRQAFLEKYLFKTDGRSAERLLSILSDN